MADSSLSSSTEPARKRMRTYEESLSPLSIAECSRSPTFWHDEGTIVLRVEDTLFRVHRDLLAVHFTVFKDVFTVPQPLDAEELDGCQVVLQSGDTCQDWETALTFVYSPLDVNPWHDRLTANKFLSLARLAHKYQGDKLFKECVRRLKTEFPDALDDFQALYPAGQPIPKIHGRTPLAMHVSDLIALLNCAIELEIERVIPTACMLLLTHHDPSVFLKPTMGRDGLEVALNRTAMQYLYLGSAQIYPALLESLRRWLHPEFAVSAWPWWCREEHDEAVARWGGLPEFEDYDPGPCKQDYDGVRERLIQLVYESDEANKMFLASFAKRQPYSHVFGDLCDTCVAREREFLHDSQLGFWQHIPSVLGIADSWKALRS